MGLNIQRTSSRHVNDSQEGYHRWKVDVDFIATRELSQKEIEDAVETAILELDGDSE